MIRLFKRRRPEPVPTIPISRGDITVAFLSGLTLAEWDALPAMAKADLRENVTHAIRTTS